MNRNARTAHARLRAAEQEAARLRHELYRLQCGARSLVEQSDMLRAYIVRLENLRPLDAQALSRLGATVLPQSKGHGNG